MNLPELPISIVEAETPEGTKYYVTFMPRDYIFESGLNPEAILGELPQPPGEDHEVTSENFARNAVFVDLMHNVIAEHGPSVPAVLAEAKRKVDGWVYVVDGRAPTPESEVSAEDIIGAFQVTGGELVPGSYQRNPNHVVLSSNGFFRLDPELQRKLYSAIVERNRGG
jgi:hypothetical protein